MAEAGANINVEKDIRGLVAEILETEPGAVDGAANFVKDILNKK